MQLILGVHLVLFFCLEHPARLSVLRGVNYAILIDSVTILTQIVHAFQNVSAENLGQDGLILFLVNQIASFLDLLLLERLVFGGLRFLNKLRDARDYLMEVPRNAPLFTV